VAIHSYFFIKGAIVLKTVGTLPGISQLLLKNANTVHRPKEKKPSD
jgi:hypothetical protein